ncbi:unnamed protein product [Psylliodes chrysocephalus]|uniref:Uncharacterized protein n=1 Tax=Psylliodes chrysocephalus TaxID=3402493 RepID=A0A9P0DET8_9CUCU|nr:unnamed protein product [Psylliodes chrysocephala]
MSNVNIRNIQQNFYSFCFILINSLFNMEHVEKTAKDYKKYLQIDLNSAVNPLSNSIDEMLTQLEEFEIMMTFLVQDRKDYKDILTSIPNYKAEFTDLCNKIDTIERLISHIKSNLDELESEVEKAETNLGCTEKTVKVTQIFTPLFKKNVDKKNSFHHSELFKTENYFQ